MFCQLLSKLQEVLFRGAAGYREGFSQLHPFTFDGDYHVLSGTIIHSGRFVESKAFNIPSSLYYLCNICFKVHIFSLGIQARSIMSNILNLCTALTACGTFAGIIINSPSFKLCSSPPIMKLPSPSITCTIASKGAECSLNPCPESKANKVIVPAGFCFKVLLTTDPGLYSIYSFKMMSSAMIIHILMDTRFQK